MHQDVAGSMDVVQWRKNHQLYHDVAGSVATRMPCHGIAMASPWDHLDLPREPWEFICPRPSLAPGLDSQVVASHSLHSILPLARLGACAWGGLHCSQPITMWLCRSVCLSTFVKCTCNDFCSLSRNWVPLASSRSAEPAALHANSADAASSNSTRAWQPWQQSSDLRDSWLAAQWS